VKVVFLSTHDLAGGAGRAAYRLFKGIQETGIDAYMYVLQKDSGDPDVKISHGRLKNVAEPLRRRLDQAPVKIRYPNGRGLFSPAWLPERVRHEIKNSGADIVHIHWIASGFVRIESLEKFDIPIVWTMHDMWPFTGGCHYDDDCGRYRQQCSLCPAIGSDNDRDLARSVFRRKLQHWRNLDLTLVSPSKWLAGCAKESALFGERRVEVIPNGIDSAKFFPVEKSVARKLIQAPQDKKIILFGAMNASSDKRKGYDYLIPAMKRLAGDGWADRACLVIFGAPQGRDSPDFGIPAIYLGELKDDLSMAVVYSAADVFVAPSVQDNLPNTVMEAIACGTPCVAYDIGGIPDMIEHKKTGYLAKHLDSDGLAAGISWILSDDARRNEISRECRASFLREYDVNLIARRYISLYKDVLTKKL